VLQHGERVVDDLTDWLVSEDTDNSTHRPSLPGAFSQLHARNLILLRLRKKYLRTAQQRYVAEMKRRMCFGAEFRGDI
jgi:hypothetical protein